MTDSSTGMNGYQLLADLVAVQGLGVAVVAGTGAALVLGADARQAISFGAVASLGVSVGDWVLTSVGVYAKLETYMKDSSYVDPADFVSGAASVAFMEYYLTGITGNDLMKVAAVGAVAGGVGRKAAAYLHDWALGTGSFAQQQKANSMANN
jgi:hypothetical protein